jgi:probable O-glycosylation ligase (exosortase A-associated)
MRRRSVTEAPPMLDAGVDEKRTEIYYWWLMLAIFFEYARPGSFVPALNAIKANTLIPISLLVMVLFTSGFRSFRQIFADRQVRWLTAFLGLIALSVSIAVVTERAFNTFTMVLGYYLLFLIIARVATSWRRLRGVILALIAAHLFLIAMTPDIVTNTDVRSYIEGGTFLGDGNDFTLSLCILVPLAIEVAFGGRSVILRVFAWVSILLFLLAIVGSQSRGATLGIAGVGVFLWLLSRRKIASLAGILLLVAVMMFHASDAYFERMSTISTYQNEGSAQGRIMAWKAGVNMAVTNPVFGVGAGHFPIAFGTTHKPRDVVGPMPWLTAHSSYFLVLGELGFPGIITFLALVIGGFRSAMKVRRRVLQSQPQPLSPGTLATARALYLLSAGMIGFAVAGAFLSATYYPHIFILTGILYSARTVALSELEKSKIPSAEPQPTALRRGRAVRPDRAPVRIRRGSGT